MTNTIPVGASEKTNKVFHKFLLRLLNHFNQDQFEPRSNWVLANVMDESCITGETQVVILTCKTVKPSIVQSLKPESKNRFDCVTFGTESFDKLSRKVFVQQYPHAA
jgi:hypothetical protein